MARIRTVKPDFWTDEKVVERSFEARLLFIGLFNFADDNGNMVNSHRRIKMQIFPADVIDCKPLIDELIKHGLVISYEFNGINYLNIKGFKKHQYIKKPSKTIIPELSSDATSSAPVPHQYPTSTPPVGEECATEGKGRDMEKDLNPHSNARAEISPLTPDPSANNSVIDNRPPSPGGFGSVGKFAMFDDWKPDKDFGKKAALWGLTISEPVSNAELAEFIDYWKAEGKARHHVQWEQTLAKSLKRSRNHPQGGNHVRAGKRVGTESNFKGNAVEAVHAATAELRKKYGLDGNSQNDKDLGANGGALFGQVDETKRGDTVITLDKSNWKAV